MKQSTPPEDFIFSIDLMGFIHRFNNALVFMDTRYSIKTGESKKIAQISKLHGNRISLLAEGVMALSARPTDTPGAPNAPEN
jgi:hypothetical protein